jgi:hypothetical protein
VLPSQEVKRKKRQLLGLLSETEGVEEKQMTIVWAAV